MNKIENFEAACAITGDDPKKEHSKQDRLEIMIKAINNNVPADWGNGERKYYPWFDVVKDESKPSGFGLSYGVYGVTYACTSVGSRLTFREIEGVEYMVKNHLEYYEAVYL